MKYVKLVNSKKEEKVLNKFFSLEELESQKEIKYQNIINKDGGEQQGSDFAERPVVMTGVIINRNLEQLQQEVDELYKFLQHEPVHIYPDSEKDRYISCVLQNDLQNKNTRGWVQFEFEFIAPDPFFYSSGKVRSEVIETLAEDFVVNNQGSIAVEPVITLTFNDVISNPVIENLNTGHEIILNEDFANDDVVVIDCQRMTVTLNDNNALSLVNDGFLLDGFELQAGENGIEVRMENNSDLVVEIAYKNKWI